MKRLLLLALASLAACQAKPSIDFFKADRTDVEAGDVVTLTWKVRNLDQLVLDPGSQLLSGTEAQVTLTQTQTLTLVARRRVPFAGVVSTRASITINVATRPIVPAFSAAPAQVVAGTPVTLSWKSTGDSVVIDSDNGSLGSRAGSGQLTVTPSATTLYTLRAHTPADPQPAAIPLRVRVAAAPTAHLTSDKQAVTAGESVTLQWTAAGASGFALDNGIGFVGPATSFRVRPAATTTYHLTAYGAAGTQATAAATVTVSGPAAGARSLQYTDPTVPADAALALVRDASSTDSVLVLKLVTTKAVAAGGLALDLPLDATRVALDAAATGDASPGFTVTAAGLNPGSAPIAAKAVLGAGPLANTLVVALAQKADGTGAVPDAQLAAGQELCRVRLVPAQNAQPGAVLPLAGAAVKALLTHLPRDPAAPLSKVAVGTLTLL